jgi:plastocyanin
LLLAGALALGLGGACISRVALGQGVAAPTAPDTHVVVAGFGDSAAAANVFAPQVQEIFVGDTVTWRIGGTLEPHTITFGPPALIEKLVAGLITPIMQKAGPPIIALNSRAALPTRGHTYDGTGLANSGLLDGTGKSWSLTFTKPGTYRYICLIHYTPGHASTAMQGQVIVQPRPAASHAYFVSMGSRYDTDTSMLDSFNPRHLTIHIGDSVTWIGAFHTVTFGPDAERTQVEQHIIVPIIQQGGQPMLAFNSKLALPAGGKTYDGTGWVSSGLMTPTATGPARYTLTFTRPGTYDYDCLLHPHMDGTITVLP